MVTVHAMPFAKATSSLSRCYATNFAHKMAFPSSVQMQKSWCKHLIVCILTDAWTVTKIIRPACYTCTFPKKNFLFFRRNQSYLLCNQHSFLPHSFLCFLKMLSIQSVCKDRDNLNQLINDSDFFSKFTSTNKFHKIPLNIMISVTIPYLPSYDTKIALQWNFCTP